MIIVAIAWIYVVLMMAIFETSVIAGIATFLFYCAFPLSIVLYLMRGVKRKQSASQIRPSLRANSTNPEPNQANDTK